MALEQMSEETSKELATTLRSLDVTMRQHMTILKKSKDTLLASMKGRQTSLPLSAPVEPVTARAVELRGDKGEEIVEVTRNRKVTTSASYLQTDSL